MLNVENPIVSRPIKLPLRTCLGQCEGCNHLVFDDEEHKELNDGTVVHDDYECLSKFVEKL